MKSICLLSLLVVCLTFNTATSQNFFKHELGFQSDNDAYLAIKQDKYYTNGLFITYRHASDQSKLHKTVNKKIWFVELGHQIFNPFSGSISNIVDVDRPFAGFAYLGGGLNWLYNSENSLKLFIKVGAIGPSARGKEVQETLHKLAGFYPIRGWEYQVNNEAAVNTTLTYNRFLHRNESNTTDFTLASYLNAGNTFAGAGAAILFRTGIINQLFNSVSTQSTISNNPTSVPMNKKELFFYLKPTLHIVVYDATIQGGMFVKDKGPVTYTITPVVFSQEAGLNYAQNRWTLNFGITFKSKEVKSRAKAHQYGTAAIYYRFN